MGVHDKQFTWRVMVGCSCHPGYEGVGDTRKAALKDLEDKIEEASQHDLPLSPMNGGK